MSWILFIAFAGSGRAIATMPMASEAVCQAAANRLAAEFQRNNVNYAVIACLKNQ